MPFTLAHPAITLPILRSKRISATTLVVGSMVPDVEYFITMRDDCTNAHTLGAIFFEYLPLTILISIIFHTLIRKEFLGRLVVPRWSLKTLTASWKNYLWEHGVVILYSALLGIASHMVWDSFTHMDTFFTAPFSAFYHERFHVFGFNAPFSIYMQYFSSIFGCFTMLIYLVARRGDLRRIMTRARWGYWQAVVAIVGLVMAIRIAEGGDVLTHTEWIICLTTASFIGLSLGGSTLRMVYWMHEQLQLLFNSTWQHIEQVYTRLPQLRLPQFYDPLASRVAPNVADADRKKAGKKAAVMRHISPLTSIKPVSRTTVARSS